MLQSIDKKFITSVLILLILSISKSFGLDINKIDTNKGILTLMYHRFEENKYPSTNIKNDVFLKHLKEIKNLGLEFIDYQQFKKLKSTSISPGWFPF